MLVKHLIRFIYNMLAMRDKIAYNKGMLNIMAKTQRGSMDARISCTSDVRDTLSGFIQGADIKYDDVLRWFMEEIGLDPTSGSEAGIRKGLEYRNKIRSYDAERKDDE